MATNPQLSVGTTFWVAPEQPATEDVAGYEALTYTKVAACVTSLGSFGGSASVQNTTCLEEGVVQKAKAEIDYGQASATMNDLVDVGKDMLKDGFDGAQRNTVHSFKVVSSDGRIKYFTAIITSYVYNVGSSTDFETIETNVDLTSKVLEDNSVIGPPLVIAPFAPIDQAAGAYTYDASICFSGATSYALVGTLTNTGLDFDPATGIISGTAVAGTDTGLDIEGINASGSVTTTDNASITIT